jgi:hypothetical protein
MSHSPGQHPEEEEEEEAAGVAAAIVGVSVVMVGVQNRSG